MVAGLYPGKIVVMKVFLSSVRRGLVAERDYLPDLLRAVGHEPSRFEDFGARDASSRAECLAGVGQADVYVLLLGPYYGDPMEDSVMSATAEEFTYAQQRGIPILVFVKNNVEVEPAQGEFMSKVGDYQQGRFWAQFNDLMDLGVKVVAALKDLALPKAPLTFAPLATALTVSWRAERRALPQPRGSSTPVLEVQVLPVGPGSLSGVAGLPDLAQSLAGRARDLGFFGQGDPLAVGSDGSSAWAVRTASAESAGPTWAGMGGFGDRRVDPYSGLALHRDGTVLAFQSLPTDTLGALINTNDLQQRLTVLLRLTGAFLPETEHVALAVSLEPLDRVAEGDPNDVGRRNRGSMPHGQGRTARLAPEDHVPTSALPDDVRDLARELAARLLTSTKGANQGSGWF